MPDYSQGKIYTIRCKDDDSLIYVGSTIQILSQRFAGHKKGSRRPRNQGCKLYKTVNGNWDNWYIELYELYPCTCKMELSKREGEVIRLIGNLNKNIAGRTPSEYYKEKADKIKECGKQYRLQNDDKIKECGKQYRLQNADKIKEKKKQYRLQNADKIKEKKKQYRLQNADKIKEYRLQNADKIKEQKKQYRLQNADKIKEYREQNKSK